MRAFENEYFENINLQMVLFHYVRIFIFICTLVESFNLSIFHPIHSNVFETSKPYLNHKAVLEKKIVVIFVTKS